MSFDFSTLVTDRTESDAAYAKVLSGKGLNGMSNTEKAEWLSGLKGAYNASDLNRVETAVAYLAETLRTLPDILKEYAASKGVAWDAFFDVPYDPLACDLTTKIDWSINDVPTFVQMKRYLSNVVTLCEALSLDTTYLPDSMVKLNWQGANAIEKALESLDRAIKALETEIKAFLDKTAAAWMYSGDLYAGEV